MAMVQARLVADLISGVDRSTECDFVVVKTEGDRRRAAPIWTIGGKGVFVREVQAAVLDGRADLAVHSAKDLPSSGTPGLVIAAVPRRGDPRDVLVGAALDGLEPGAVVATGSPRRRAQLAWMRPDLLFEDLRGNMRTRLSAVGRVDAVVASYAALERIGMLDRVAEVLDPDRFVPQAGQGALAVECREDRADLVALLSRLDDPESHACLDAERAFLATLGGSCDLPAGAHARVEQDELVLCGFLATHDGHWLARERARGTDPVAVGSQVAEALVEAFPRPGELRTRERELPDRDDLPPRLLP